MKDKREIIIRAIILLLLSDRCALERNVIEGENYSKFQREKQRNVIINWLERNNYLSYLTNVEKEIFNQKVDRVTNTGILAHQIQYEAILPCLWAVGLADCIAKYDDYVYDDFHLVLDARKDHSLEKLLLKTTLRDEADILYQREVAMLWNWRIRECNKPVFREISMESLVLSVFGKVHADIVKEMTTGDDLLYRGKAIYKCSQSEIAQLSAYSYWRQYAFEWITSDSPWDKVEVNT